MPFEAEQRDEGWFVGDGPISFGPYRSRENADNAAVELNLQTQNGARVPFETRRGGGVLNNMRQASNLLRSGRSDEEVERLTGVSLADILSLRAMLATSERPATRADRFSGRRWWS